MNWIFRQLQSSILLRAVALAMLLLIAQPISTAFADTLREVAERVARQNDAKLVSAREVTDRDGRKVYVIRILTRDGVVRTIRVPAQDRHKLNTRISLLSVDGDWQINMNLAVDAHTGLRNPPVEMLQSNQIVQGRWV